MKRYKLNAKLIDNKVAMMIAIMGCLYDSLCLEQDNYAGEDKLKLFNRLMQTLILCSKISLKPYEELGSTYDAIELLDEAAQINKIEEFVNKLCEYIKEPIQIVVMDYSYSDKTELFDLVPNFPNDKVLILK